MAIVNKIKNRLVDYGINNVQGSNGRRVVMYHGIDLVQSRKYNGRFIGIKNFEKQIRYFKKHFHISSLEDFFLHKTNKNKFEIAITFDDGLQNNFKYALPILEKYGVPATFFVTGINNCKEKILWNDLYDISKSEGEKDFEFNGILFHKNKEKKNYFNSSNQRFQEVFKLDNRTIEEKTEELIRVLVSSSDDFRRKAKYDDYWKLMSDMEISLTAQSKYVTVGSHGMYHNNLGIQDEVKSEEELVLSKKYLEKVTGKEIQAVAYPDGSYTRRLIDAAEKLGFKQQCVVNYLFEEDKTDARIIDRHDICALEKPDNTYRTAYNIVKPY